MDWQAGLGETHRQNSAGVPDILPCPIHAAVPNSNSGDHSDNSLYENLTPDWGRN
jgi:hypothetical protein